MNRIRIAVTLAFFLLFVGFAYAQEPQEQPKPRPEEARPEPGREASQPAHQTQEEAKPSRPEEAKPPRQEEAKPPKAEKQESPKASQESQPAHAEKGQERETQPAHAEKSQESQQGHARPAGKSARIPDPKFKASFGRPHSFRVNQVIQQTTVVPGQTQFIYSGYTFVILDPWPAEWLYTDDCYIDYVDDDYYLFDAFHPGIRVALFVVG
jgi:cytoskeletal protein RodZ